MLFEILIWKLPELIIPGPGNYNWDGRINLRLRLRKQDGGWWESISYTDSMVIYGCSCPRPGLCLLARLTIFVNRRVVSANIYEVSATEEVVIKKSMFIIYIYIYTHILFFKSSAAALPTPTCRQDTVYTDKQIRDRDRRGSLNRRDLDRLDIN